MAVEASHLNLFPTQVLANRQFNHTDNNISADLYNNGNLIPSTGKSSGINNTVNSFLPVYNHHMSAFNNNNTATTEVLLQQIAAKTSSYVHHHTPLRDDSGLTYTNNIVPPPPVCSRKRSRENSTVTVNHNSPYYSMPLSAGSVGNVAVPVKRNDGGGLAMADNYTFLGEDMSVELINHQSEFDRWISLHMEKLRSEVEERQRKQLSRVAYAIQQAVAKKLKDKEEELEKMNKVNCYLEQKTESLYLENQIWRDMAQNNEATANALRDNLEQVLATQACNNHPHDVGLETTRGVVVEDVGSCCGSSSGNGGDDGEDEVNTQQVLKWRKVAATPAIVGDNNRKVCTKVISEEDRKTEWKSNYCWVKNENNNDKEKSESTRMCRKCGNGESTVLLLPCRHLCLCANCGPTVNNCPICNFIKDGSVHVYLS